MASGAPPPPRASFQPHRAPRTSPGEMEQPPSRPACRPGSTSCPSAGGVPLGPSLLPLTACSSGNGIMRLDSRPPSLLGPPRRHGPHTEEVSPRPSALPSPHLQTSPPTCGPSPPLFLPRGPWRTRPRPCGSRPFSTSCPVAAHSHRSDPLRVTTGACSGPSRARQASSCRKTLGVCLWATLQAPPAPPPCLGAEPCPSAPVFQAPVSPEVKPSSVRRGPRENWGQRTGRRGGTWEGALRAGRASGSIRFLPPPSAPRGKVLRAGSRRRPE